MIILKDDTYRAMSDLLIEQISQSAYFSGTIEYDNDEFYSILLATLIVEYKKNEYLEGVSDNIMNITPVWCEYKTYLEVGEVCNSFSWDKFSSYLPQGVIN